MHHQIRSYFSEELCYCDKQLASCRLFYEDCAVIDPCTLRILASRGSAFSDSDIGILCNAPSVSGATELPILLPYKKGTALLLPGFLSCTSLLPCLYIPAPSGHVAQALEHLERSVLWADSPHKTAPLSFGELSLLCDRMCEILYYTDRLTGQTPVGMWTLCRLIAHFAGCNACARQLPVQMPALTKADQARLSLFLLCSFLFLRETGGSVCITGGSSPADSFSLCFSSPDGTPVKPSVFPLFLQEPCFSPFLRMSTDTEFPSVIIPLSIAPALCARDVPATVLYVTFSFSEGAQNEI